MMASDLVDFPATNEALTELACWLAAAYARAADPIPNSEDPLRTAATAMAAREHRIFFIETHSFAVCFSSGMKLRVIPAHKAGSTLEKEAVSGTLESLLQADPGVSSRSDCRSGVHPRARAGTLR